MTCPVYRTPQVRKITAQICLNEITHPVIPGSKYKFHFGLMSQLGTIKKIRAEYEDNSFEKIVRKKPRLLNSRSCAVISLKLDKRLPMELYSNFPTYGTFQISNEFDTVGFGRVIVLND